MENGFFKKINRFIFYSYKVELHCRDFIGGMAEYFYPCGLFMYILTFKGIVRRFSKFHNVFCCLKVATA